MCTRRRLWQWNWRRLTKFRRHCTAVTLDASTEIISFFGWIDIVNDDCRDMMFSLLGLGMSGYAFGGIFYITFFLFNVYKRFLPRRM